MGVDEILKKQAIEKGVTQKKHSFHKNAISNMRKEDFSIEIIANILSLSESEVEAYFKELNLDTENQK